MTATYKRLRRIAIQKRRFIEGLETEAGVRARLLAMEYPKFSAGVCG